ncbi:hypothetical protein H312_00694 [Anncaliia algerae PRA339]|uniref:GATA-type domain-containing protein n=1 Tax=Anncaliia algerae PRA339 TaxID=1288291 RepID=A0A059F3W4_9MICR|nr:hypothetical protein H312_00694 [Anncaliia algerae PRA339]
MCNKKESSSSNDYRREAIVSFEPIEENAEKYNVYYNQIAKNDQSDKPACYANNQSFPQASSKRKSLYSYYSSNIPSDFKKRIRVCQNCKVTNSPSWRKSPCGKYILCNACGLYAKLHNRSRPFVSMRDGRTKVIKRHTPQAISCYFCKEIKGVRPRIEANGRMCCDFCWNNLIMQNQSSYYPQNDYGVINYGSSYQPSSYESYDINNRNFALYFPKEPIFEHAQPLPHEDFYKVTELVNFKSEYNDEDNNQEQKYEWNKK